MTCCVCVTSCLGYIQGQIISSESNTTCFLQSPKHGFFSDWAVIEGKQHRGSGWHSCSRNVCGQQTQSFQIALQLKANTTRQSSAQRCNLCREAPHSETTPPAMRRYKHNAVLQRDAQAHATNAPIPELISLNPKQWLVSSFLEGHSPSHDRKGLKKPLMSLISFFCHNTR